MFWLCLKSSSGVNWGRKVGCGRDRARKVVPIIMNDEWMESIMERSKGISWDNGDLCYG